MHRIFGFAILFGLVAAFWLILSGYLKRKRRMRGSLRIRLPVSGKEDDRE